jgi:hypothetical protein
VPTFSIARALVALAENSDVPDDDATVAARYEWGSLLEPPAVRR